MSEGVCAHCGGLVDEHGLAKLPEAEESDAAEALPSEPPPDDAVDQLFTEALKARP